ncbi:hypothetical protein Pmani_003736 [Petrolisthes manimaculis]|uniref:Antistasin-like domain-containing protein n=1 Tax=Petrolisthes manimaculis TaxID=1843537 RepID=A0AAE1QFW0_9EUCA|nr:hypothetical protein Pmani_003736 [Petrolisthes manimaculis]
MLCPYEFELDEEGCPLCQCRDPCKGRGLPRGSLSCTLEETHCDSEPCPPMPTCKQPRSLSMPPPLYRCHVAQGRDYGVCCAAVEELEKPGQCPMEGGGGSVVVGAGGEEEEMRCGASCLHDLQLSLHTEVLHL